MNAKSLPPTREATLAEAHATVTELTEAIDARPPGRVPGGPGPSPCTMQNTGEGGDAVPAVLTAQRGRGPARTMTVTYIPGQEHSSEETWPSPPDPGDLSRRIARRRADLKLSRAQVAARAGISPRYLEYLERYPARPSVLALRQVAAALRTTPAMLLGAGAQGPARHGCPAAVPVTVKLGQAECWRLIAAGGIGRIGFTTASGPLVMPVNFAVVAGTIVIRTAHGSLIQAHAFDQVAFEVDDLDDALCQGWSVLVSGPAHQVLQPDELRHLREHCAVRPWPGGKHEVYVRIAPTRITGRSVEAQ